MQPSAARGADWIHAVRVPEQYKFAKFIACTVPLEGGHLVIVARFNVEAASGTGVAGYEDLTAFEIVVTMTKRTRWRQWW